MARVLIRRGTVVGRSNSRALRWYLIRVHQAHAKDDAAMALLAVERYEAGGTVETVTSSAYHV